MYSIRNTVQTQTDQCPENDICENSSEGRKEGRKEGREEIKDSHVNYSDVVELCKKDNLILTNSEGNIQFVTAFRNKFEINCISAVSPEQAYLSSSKRRDPESACKEFNTDCSLSCLRLMNGCGEETISDRIETTFYVEDFIAIEREKILVTDFMGQKIHRINFYNEIEWTKSTIPYHPTGICHLHDDSVMVAMCHLDESEGKLVKYSKNGSLLNTLEGKHSKKSPVYKRPYRLAENCHNNLITIDAKQQIAIATDQYGNIIWTFKGEAGTGFDPVSVCCDGVGRAIILDRGGKQLYFLSPQGILDTRSDLSQYNADIRQPRCMTIDAECKLWIGSSSTVTIFQLIYKER